MSYEATAAFAAEMDRLDPLAVYRESFHVPAGTVYLCGNSLGLQPRATAAALQQELEDWQQLGVEGHVHARNPWMPYHEFLTPQLARLCGALPTEVVAMNGLSVNLHLMMVSFYRPTPQRHKIIMESQAFPSDRYAVESQLGFHGYYPADALVLLAPRDGEHTVRAEDIEAAIALHGQQTALVLIGGVNYYTGQLFDMHAITQLAHGQGCMVGFDLAHAIGNVPLRLHDWGPDFCAWCSYKYLNAGPGSVAGCFVHERHANNETLPRFAGWWGQDKATRFDMQPEFHAIAGAEGWQLSNPPVLSMAAVKASLDIFDEVGMDALHAKAVQLTGYLEFLLDELHVADLQIITPRDSAQRGCQLSITLGHNARQVFERPDCAQDYLRLARARVHARNAGSALQQLQRRVALCSGAGRVLRCEGQMMDATVTAAKQEITLVGGGLVGALSAILLARRGFRAQVYDRRPDMRRVEVAAGRSINLAVTARGLLALEQVELRQAVLDLAIPMRGRMVHPVEGETAFIAYGQREHEVIYSVGRGTLNKLLLDHAGKMPGVTLHFNQRCTAYDSTTGAMVFHDELSGFETKVQAATVLATDGSGSQVRAAMLQQMRVFNYQQSFLSYGYKELVIPAAVDGSFAMEKNALHIWPRKSYMLIALPNLDGSFTCTLFLSFDGESSFASLQTPSDATAFFEQNFADALRLMPTLAHDFAANPTSPMITVKCSPWHVAGNVGSNACLIGDAAHAIVPFFGQGMNCGFEDCTALGNLLDEHGNSPDWAALFAALEAERKPNADAIADMAVENFVEMRDTVADPKFQLKKQIGFELERRHPEAFIPRYSMVVFHPEIPYAEARRRGIAQDKLLDTLTADADSMEQVNWEHAEQLLHALS